MVKCLVQSLKSKNDIETIRVSLYRVVGQIWLPCFGWDLDKSTFYLSTLSTLGVPVESSAIVLSEDISLFKEYAYGIKYVDSFDKFIKKLSDKISYLKSVERIFSCHDYVGKTLLNRAAEIILSGVDGELEGMDYNNAVIDVNCHGDINTDIFDNLKKSIGCRFVPVVRRASLGEGYFCVSFIAA